MSVAIEQVARPTEIVDHRPWWRGRPGQSMAVIAGLLIAFVAFRNEAAWPASVRWDTLSGHLDTFQTWLSTQRNAPGHSFVFSAFNDLASFLDDLVTWLDNLLTWLTWVGTTALGI